MLCARVKPAIVGQQSVDQAAYRQGFSTEDHLITLTLLLEASSEWNLLVWLGLVDFEKAFDTVEHAPLWDALEQLGVQTEYIDLLKTLYHEQASTVLAGEESRAFSLERGVKQGDPVSSLLFLAVMEVIFRKLKKKWGKLNLRRTGAYYGVVIDDERDPLTNLRFADDILLFATSRRDIAKMIADVDRQASRQNENIDSKTKILTNATTSRQSPVSCAGKDVQVLQEGESEKYLGRKLSIDVYHVTELNKPLSFSMGRFFQVERCTVQPKRATQRSNRFVRIFGCA